MKINNINKIYARYKEGVSIFALAKVVGMQPTTLQQHLHERVNQNAKRAGQRGRGAVKAANQYPMSGYISAGKDGFGDTVIRVGQRRKRSRTGAGSPGSNTILPEQNTLSA